MGILCYGSPASCESPQLGQITESSQVCQQDVSDNAASIGKDGQMQTNCKPTFPLNQQPDAE